MFSLTDAGACTAFALAGLVALQCSPLWSAQQWLQVLPSAQLHHQVEDLPEQHQPKTRSLLKPWKPQVHKLLQMGLPPWVDPVQPMIAGHKTFPTRAGLSQHYKSKLAEYQLHRTMCR